jgi:hypothetical protein
MRRVRNGQRHAGWDRNSGGSVLVQEMQDIADQDAETAIDEGLDSGWIGDGLVDIKLRLRGSESITGLGEL